MPSPRPRLGKGLEALIPKTVLMAGKTITNIPIASVQPNPYQPRIHFDQKALQTLSDSIRRHGLNQPIIVRRQGDYFELIAGERRYRASLMADLQVIPAIIKNVSDQESLQIALIENLEREDLNCIEEAKGYLRLIQEFSLTHHDVSELFGRSRSAVSNTLRLLNLPHDVQQALAEGDISEGHARSLLALESEDNILEAFEFMKKNALNVRQTEAHISAVKKRDVTKKQAQAPIEKLVAREKELAKILDCPVKIKGTPNKGKIEIEYRTPEQLERLYLLLQETFSH